MASNAALQEELAPITACTISRDVQNFDLLIEDMEAECGESWGDLSFEDAGLFLQQPDADALEFVALAIDQEDEEHIDVIGDLVKLAKERDVNVVVIAEEVSPIALHQLIKLGAAEFVPYPLPDGALNDALTRIRRAAELASQEIPDEMRTKIKATGDRDGVVLPVQGLSGGTGTTTTTAATSSIQRSCNCALHRLVPVFVGRGIHRLVGMYAVRHHHRSWHRVDSAIGVQPYLVGGIQAKSAEQRHAHILPAALAIAVAWEPFQRWCCRR